MPAIPIADNSAPMVVGISTTNRLDQEQHQGDEGDGDQDREKVHARHPRYTAITPA
jgi:hypothetical protein